jgi:hypothetical protein
MIDYEQLAEGVEVPQTSGAPAEPTPPPSPAAEEVIPPEQLAAKTREFYPIDHPKYQGIATAKGYSQETARIIRTHYSHEAMIDEIIANPNIKQNELAQKFEKTVPWISRIIGSDAFQAALAKRREEITDPFLIATVEERFKGLANQSLDIIAEKLESTKNTDLALKALDISVKALGFGSRGGGATQNNQFVIQLPPKSANSADWAADHGPMKQVGNG